MARTETHEEKMQARIGKLVRQAEGAAEGSPEREAFMERAMTLSQAHSIDMALARAKAYSKDKAEEPEQREYQVGTIGQGRNKAKANAHFVDLVLGLASAFDMKPLISHSNVYVWLMGYPSDHDMVAKMFSMLSVQMVEEADAALARGENKSKRYLPRQTREKIPHKERNWGGYDHKTERWFIDRFAYEELCADYGVEHGDPLPDYAWVPGGRYGEREVKPHLPPASRMVDVKDSTGRVIMEEKVVSDTDARIWRANFYLGYVSRVGRRMRQARETALRDAGVKVDESTEKGIALLNKKAEINDRYETEMLVRASKRGKGFGGAEVSSHSHQAHAAGQSAAEKATYGDERVVD